VTAPGVFEAVLRGELDGWQGLPAGVTPESLGRELGPVADVRPPGEAMRASRRFTVTVVERPAPPKRVLAWVEAGRTDIAIIDVEEPRVVDLDGVLQRFGRPDLLLSDRRFAPDAQVREWVYARRGLAFSIAEPFESPGSRGRHTVHLELFEAMTPETYITAVDRGAELLPKTHPETAR
jgi:hypothetical protein